MAINSKILQVKIFFSRTRRPMNLKLGMTSDNGAYKVCINHYPGMTLTYFTARSPMHLNVENCQNVISREKLERNGQMDRILMFMKKNCPHGLSASAPGLYMTIIFKHLL